MTGPAADGVRVPRVNRLRRAVLNRLPGPVRALLRAVRSRWRRSLQLRVVAATVALGLVIVALVGQFVLVTISDGLVSSRVESLKSESLQSYNDALRGFEGTTLNDESEVAAFLQSLVTRLSGPAERQTRYVVAVKQRDTVPGGAPGGVPDLASQGIEPNVIPDDLRRNVVESPNVQQVQLLTLDVRADQGLPRAIRAIVVGTGIDFGPLAGGPWELYFVYDLEREVSDLDLVRQTFLVGGLALVLLVGASAWLVTRQVVTPVRLAARTAEQLAAGRLDKRMRVRGEDDLARLGRGFNEMAASLERQIMQLEELSRVQRRFVSDVSHELRTPLTTIRMAGEVIYEARAGFDPISARSAELLQAQLDRFESLLADLLEVSRFDAGAAELETDAVDLGEVVQRVVDGLRPLADRKGSRIEVLTPAAPCVAAIDVRRVERIVRNLVGNAIEHGEGRPVTVTLASDGEAVAVAVRDHGVGLRPGELRMVFNRFWRADPARARTTGGTGLGLAIALEDAHLHGGWLQVWGEPARGTNFRLTLPARAGVSLSSSPLPLVPPEAHTQVGAAPYRSATPTSGRGSGAAVGAGTPDGEPPRSPSPVTEGLR